ncbi:hypothetical protein WR25_16352 [Diploscapter pachys]|uniref:Uncharacterized protein n=1 Tax=Diploscapter pachys TaxID=2018661 RepID=A0A2A2LAW9_9BILA|nr:hypothetical protein WR25_16352 [Diploscapter pachys]
MTYRAIPPAQQATQAPREHFYISQLLIDIEAYWTQRQAFTRSDGRQPNSDALEFCAQDEEGATSGTHMIDSLTLTFSGDPSAVYFGHPENEGPSTIKDYLVISFQTTDKSGVLFGTGEVALLNVQWRLVIGAATTTRHLEKDQKIKRSISLYDLFIGAISGLNFNGIIIID